MPIKIVSGDTPPNPKPKFTILASYAYLRELKGKDLDWVLSLHERDAELFLDSGAFSAFNAGKEIELEEYMEFLKNHEESFFGYMQLDKLQDPETSERNLHTMLDAGFKPIPIHVFGDDEDRMNELFSISDRVALGGFRRPHRGPAPKNYVLKKMEWAAGRNVHWLGYTPVSMLMAMTPYSCDCSNWGSGEMWGHIRLYEGNGIMRNVHRKDKWQKPLNDAAVKFIEYCGFTVDQFFDDNEWHREDRGVKTGLKYLPRTINAVSWLKYTLDMQRKIGTRIFIATTVTSPEIVVLDWGMKRILDENNGLL